MIQLLHSPLFRKGCEAALLLLALVSLAYAVITAPQHGEDLLAFRRMGEAWLAGIYRMGSGIYNGPPPFAAVLFAPLALTSFELTKALFVIVNLAAAALCLYLASKLWGSEWTTRTKLFLGCLLLAFAPFRVTLRLGQISLIIVALLFGAVLAHRKNRRLLAGLLLGLALTKYPLTLPFFLYFLWRREWRMAGAAILVLALLTTVYALGAGVSPLTVVGDYFHYITHRSLTADHHFAGTTEIGPLLLVLTGGNEVLADRLTILVAGLGLLAMLIVFRRKPQFEDLHLVIVALYTLWFVYHRTYDSVLCLAPAAVLLGFIRRGEHLRFAYGWLAALGLLVVSLPGFLTERLRLSAEALAANPFGLLGLHIERLLIFGMFLAFLRLLWQQNASRREAEIRQPAPAALPETAKT